VEWAIDGQVVDVLGGSNAQVFCKIDNSEIVLHVLLGNVFHPIWNGG
jgi:hypothetical protein